MNDGIDFHIDGEVARLTFNRPDKMNAITHDMWSAIPDVVAAVEGDPGAKVLVVTGAGPHFSAGADIGEFRALRSTAEGAAVYDKAVTAAVQALSSLRKPSVAMVHGNCIGGGCQLAVACDFRFAAADARSASPPASSASSTTFFPPGSWSRSSVPRTHATCCCRRSLSTPRRRGNWDWSTRSSSRAGWRRPRRSSSGPCAPARRRRSAV